MSAQLHEQGYAAAAIVGAHERIAPIAAIVLLVSDRSCIVMRTQDHSPFALGIEGDDDIGHLDWLPLALLPRLKALELNLARKAFEVFLDQFLLLGHTGRAADPWADLADFLQIAHGTLGVDGEGMA